jgi:hypothetical protein
MVEQANGRIPEPEAHHITVVARALCHESERIMDELWKIADQEMTPRTWRQVSDSIECRYRFSHFILLRQGPKTHGCCF